MAAEKEPARRRPKIWVNAAPFGFGPSAIAFKIFPQLQKLVAVDAVESPFLEYAGSGLSLDFNARLPWHAIHDIDVHGPGGPDKLADLYWIHRPDLIISVLDFPFAETSIKLGAKVIIVDSLLWYWTNVPVFYTDADLLLAPNFVGVQQRIEECGLANARLLPWIGPHLSDGSSGTNGSQPRKGTLINLGGLQTPFSAVSENVKYARCMLQGVQDALHKRGHAEDEPLTALVSESVRQAIQAEFPFVQTTDPEQARRLLRICRTAFMCSGMGNILDAVDYGDQVVFLPAICKSHGLQLELLRQIGVRPYLIDWQDIIAGQAKLDYVTNDPDCFVQVAWAQDAFLKDKDAPATLAQQCFRVLETRCAGVESLQKAPDVLGRAVNDEVYLEAIASAGLGFKASE